MINTQEDNVNGEREKFQSQQDAQNLQFPNRDFRNDYINGMKIRESKKPMQEFVEDFRYRLNQLGFRGLGSPKKPKPIMSEQDFHVQKSRLNLPPDSKILILQDSIDTLLNNDEEELKKAKQKKQISFPDIEGPSPNMQPRQSKAILFKGAAVQMTQFLTNRSSNKYNSYSVNVQNLNESSRMETERSRILDIGRSRNEKSESSHLKNQIFQTNEQLRRIKLGNEYGQAFLRDQSSKELMNELQLPSIKRKILQRNKNQLDNMTFLQSSEKNSPIQQYDKHQASLRGSFIKDLMDSTSKLLNTPNVLENSFDLPNQEVKISLKSQIKAGGYRHHKQKDQKLNAMYDHSKYDMSIDSRLLRKIHKNIVDTKEVRNYLNQSIHKIKQDLSIMEAKEQSARLSLIPSTTNNSPNFNKHLSMINKGKHNML